MTPAAGLVRGVPGFGYDGPHDATRRAEPGHRGRLPRRLDTGQWVLTIYEGNNAAAELPALGCELSLAEVYDKLDLLAPTTSEDE